MIGTIGNVQKLLKASYSGKEQNVNGLEIDKGLSGKRVQVYKDPNSNQAVVVHRGTQGLKDMANDLYYAAGGNINTSNRVKHAQAIQNKAEAKYGSENTTTIGHSLGGKVASTVGQNSKQIINYNKAVSPQDALKKTSNKEINIRTQYDPVSALLPKSKNTITIQSTSTSALKEHSTDALGRLNQNKKVGRF